MTKKVIILKNVGDTAKIHTHLITVYPDLVNGKEYECIIQPYHKKRSKNANDYSWYLQNEIAKILNRRIDDIHNEMILQYGVLETYSINKIAFESAKRMFDYYKVFGESSVNGIEFIHIKAGLGTHTYNSKEMATFIDGVIAEAQDLEIETKTPKEIAEMKSLWESGKR